MLRKIVLILCLAPLTICPYQDKTLQDTFNKQEGIFLASVQEAAKDTPKEILCCGVTLGALIKKALIKIKKHTIHYYTQSNGYDKNLYKEKLKKIEKNIGNKLFKNILEMDIKYKTYNAMTNDMTKLAALNKSLDQLFQLLEKKYAKQLTIIKRKHLHEISEYLPYEEIKEIIEYIESLVDKVTQEFKKAL